MTDETARVAVEQCDRDAAAALMRKLATVTYRLSEYIDGIETGNYDENYAVRAFAQERHRLAALSTLAQPAGEVREALPRRIGRLHLGDHPSDGERYCAHSHYIPAGHPAYWPESMGEYDDSDPYCLEHAIDLTESDNSWCERCVSAALADRTPPPADQGVRPDYEPAWRAYHDALSWMQESKELGAYLGWNLADIANDLIDRAYPTLRKGSQS